MTFKMLFYVKTETRLKFLFTFFLLGVWHVLVSGVRDLEDVADVRVRDVALGTLLELVNLLHLQMLNGPDVSHQGLFAGAGELAERAVIREPLQRDISVQQVFFHLLHVIEEDSGDLVLLVGHVNLDFVRAVGLELASVAAEIDRVNAGQEAQLPLVVRSSLFDVVDVAKTL